MKKLLGLLILSGLLLGGVAFAQSPIEMQDPPKRTFGAGTKPKPAFSSGHQDTKPKPPPKKTFGSGDKPKPHEDPVKPPPKKTFGSGNTPPSSTDVGTPPKTGPPKKTFGSGNTPPTPDAGGKPVNKTGFDNKAARDQKKVESKAAFTKGNAPASTYTDPKGNAVKIDPKDVKIQSLRNQLSEEKFHNRELRERNFYANYYSRPVVIYHDPYSSFFWYWMLDRTIEQQALWAYNCRYSMDQARYNQLLSNNAELAARVRALEGSGAVRNPAYTPNGMTDNDLMYQQEYVKAAYNPQAVPVASQPVDAGPVLKVLLCIFLGLAIIALVVWLIFVKKW